MVPRGHTYPLAALAESSNAMSAFLDWNYRVEYLSHFIKTSDTSYCLWEGEWNGKDGALSNHEANEGVKPDYKFRPWNSVRFICRCGRKHTFPRSPEGGRDATESYTLIDGTSKFVTRTHKEVLCPCGLRTSKQRKSFKGR
jgi:hypothetical protein